MERGRTARVIRRSAATALWLLQRLLFVVVVLLVGWVAYEVLVVPVVDDDDQIAGFLALWLVLAYVLLPRLQRILAKIYVPDYFVGRTRTSEGLLGDPVNLAVMGSTSELTEAMLAAGWTRADDLTWRTGLRLATCAVLRRPYPAAPVSPLFVFRRKQDLAFEQAIGDKVSRRHHVRLWRCPDGWFMPGGLRVEWIAAGTYDRSVGLSLFTLQVTHKIGEDIDLERDHILATLDDSAVPHSVHWVQDYFSGYRARNGGGDAISTDGNLPVIHLERP
ncbi:LssY C-terminal domain-containing protein [Solicola gregarius]|uniref:LssY C-terminal domain-containing protein n=1 Tax=Solicola gregarius TaxID=2908642 RepID=A0AA46TIJ7_9ACTN|nr:LssY C-terminal domain-containing protein [Solicola gregarius]UYM05168.1 LssY C-terminal domain-containing protein [Solicola gregarius]